MERTVPLTVDLDLVGDRENADIDHVITCGCGEVVGVPAEANRHAKCHNCDAHVEIRLQTNDFEDRRPP